nr:hypothetical protein [uncultured Kingella sp.]
MPPAVADYAPASVANARCPENGLRQLADYFALQNPSSPSVQKKE